MAWFRVSLSEKERQIVDVERRQQTHEPTRRKFEVLWLLDHGTTREKAGEMAGVARATVGRYLKAYREGGLNGLRCWGVEGPSSLLEAHRERLAESFRESPVSSVAEASERIEQLTGIRRGPTQVRAFLKKLGLSWQRVGAIPIPPKKASRNMWRTRIASSPRN